MWYNKEEQLNKVAEDYVDAVIDEEGLDYEKQNAPFKFDIVGSFLRANELKKARADYDAGTISAEQLTEVENKCIKELIEKQKKLDFQ